MRILRMLPLLLLLLSTGCAHRREQALPPDSPFDSIRNDIVDSATQAREGLAELLGLKPGRQWQYQGEGNEYAAFTAEVAYVKDHYYQIEENNGGTILARIIALQPDGAYEIHTQGEHTPGTNLLDNLTAEIDFGNAKKLLPWPVIVGARWTWPDGGDAEVTAVDQRREVPYGELSQVTQVRITTTRQVTDPATDRDVSETSVVERYYAQGVGLIEQRFTSGDFVVVSQLEKLTLTP